MGRRSPGRNGGRLVGAPGRGRWKIGWPGTGRPGAGRAPRRRGSINLQARWSQRRLIHRTRPGLGHDHSWRRRLRSRLRTRLDWPARRERRRRRRARFAVARQLVLWRRVAAGARRRRCRPRSNRSHRGRGLRRNRSRRSRKCRPGSWSAEPQISVPPAAEEWTASELEVFAAGGAGAATGLASTGGAVADRRGGCRRGSLLLADDGF